MPYSALIAAGTAALRSAAQEVGRPALNWDVIADDQYVMREFCDWADTIPLVVGSVFSEMQGTLTRGDGRKNEWSQKEIDDQLDRRLRRQEERRRRRIQAGVPAKEGAGRAVLRRRFASGREEPAGPQARKEQGAGLQLPVRVGVPDQRGTTSFHCSELAFCFHALSVPQIRTATGGGAVAMALQDKVAQAWVNFVADGQSQPAGARVEALYDRERLSRWCSTP